MGNKDEEIITGKISSLETEFTSNHGCYKRQADHWDWANIKTGMWSNNIQNLPKVDGRVQGHVASDTIMLSLIIETELIRTGYGIYSWEI